MGGLSLKLKTTARIYIYIYSPHQFSIVLNRFWFSTQDLEGTAGLKMSNSVRVLYLNLRFGSGQYSLFIGQYMESIGSFWPDRNATCAWTKTSKVPLPCCIYPYSLTKTKL